MRSFSTLLAHILGSHEEVSGYTETFLSYWGPFDLFELRCKTCIDGNFKRRCAYIMDKILHNWVQLSDQILASEDVAFLFMVRRPRETLKSIMNMERNELKKGKRPLHGSQDPGTPEAALAQYAARLEGLAETARRINHLGRTALAFEAERIVDDTRPVLEQIEQHLHLRSALHQDYSVFGLTGQSGRGDMSPYIQTGSIQRERSDYAGLELPDSCLEQAEAAYEQCVRVLEKNCITVLKPSQLML
jgi:hypothetical protein